MSSSEERSYQRKLTRHEVPFTVEVVDAVNANTLGRIVNIHTEGLMLMGEQEIPDGNLYQLELCLPQQINGRDRIALGVDCLWSRSNNEETMYWAGCKIIDISDQALADLEALIGLISN